MKLRTKLILFAIGFGVAGQLSAMQKNKELQQFKSKKPGILLQERKSKRDKAGVLWSDFDNLAKEYTYLLNKGGVKKLPANIDKKRFLLYAAKEGYLFIVKHLIEKEHVSIETKSAISDATLFHYAAKKGNLEMVKYLIEQLKNNAKKEIDVDVNEKIKTNINAKDKFGKTPLHYAAEEGHLDAVKYLVKEVEANVDMKDMWGKTPLHWAAEYGYLDIVKYLVGTAKADVNVKNVLVGRTPLHWAAEEGYLDVVKYLVTNGADKSIEDNFGKTALDVAREADRTDIVEYLENIK